MTSLIRLADRCRAIALPVLPWGMRISAIVTRLVVLATVSLSPAAAFAQT